MSNIKNEAKIRNPLIVAIREQLEHRALWMYLLCDEAAKVLPPRTMLPPLSAAADCTRAAISAPKPAAAIPSRG